MVLEANRLRSWQGQRPVQEADIRREGMVLDQVVPGQAAVPLKPCTSRDVLRGLSRVGGRAVVRTCASRAAP
jgi:hypothetical protein